CRSGAAGACGRLAPVRRTCWRPARYTWQPRPHRGRAGLAAARRWSLYARPSCWAPCGGVVGAEAFAFAQGFLRALRRPTTEAVASVRQLAAVDTHGVATGDHVQPGLMVGRPGARNEAIAVADLAACQAKGVAREVNLELVHDRHPLR